MSEPPFTMSKYASELDLLRAKTAYQEKQIERFSELIKELPGLKSALSEERRAHEAAVMVTVSKWRGEVEEVTAAADRFKDELMAQRTYAEAGDALLREALERGPVGGEEWAERVRAHLEPK